jgi:hypothetical protein
LDTLEKTFSVQWRLESMLNYMQLMNLRTEFEELSKGFSNSVGSGSSINTLKWFAEHGFRSNRLRSGYDRAMEISSIILKEYENGRAEEIRSRKSLRTF